MLIGFGLLLTLTVPAGIRSPNSIMAAHSFFRRDIHNSPFAFGTD